MSRECGDCTLCCTLLGVQDIDKPAQTKCEHECDSGCGIYETRPYSCKRFDCLWLKRLLPVWARPDKINVVFDVAKPKITGKKMPLLLIEGEDGAHKSHKLRPIIEFLGRDREVIVIDTKNAPRSYAPEIA
jgi:hypothetical protein